MMLCSLADVRHHVRRTLLFIGKMVMEAAGFSEMLVRVYNSTPYHIPGDSNLTVRGRKYTSSIRFEFLVLLITDFQSFVCRCHNLMTVRQD
jgi:hypothetical protein